MNKHERVSFNISPEDYQKIKALAALHGNTIRQYILESIYYRIRHENEEKNLLNLTTSISPVLKELWDNDNDAAYDQL
ncbi:MAG: hypothetical protein ACM3SY_06370 [Candidatus Omnitrophota bacterium]